MKNILKKHASLFIFAGITLLFYWIFIFGLGSYPLLDADETRYADIARTMFRSHDFVTMYLDGRVFWDKPPLYFWIECLSFAIFKTCSEFTVRIPSVTCAMLSGIGLYFIGRKLISRRFAILSSLILVTGVEYVIFAKVAILDIVLTTFITLSTLSGFVTYFAADKNKKYWWWLFYLFSALALLAKGIPGVVIPFGTMFFVGLWKKNLKEFFKPSYMLIGGLIFLAIALPWHIMMYNIHGMEFVQEYIIKHHILRFIGSETIGREHSWVYFIPVFIVGFLPWTLSFIFSFYSVIKEKKRLKLEHFVIMNLIGFVFTFLFFSIAKTKLITYILPVYPFAAVVTAYVWYKYINYKLFRKPIELSVYLTSSAFLIVGFAALVMKYFLPAPLYTEIKSAQAGVAFIFIFTGLLALYAVKSQKRMLMFCSYVFVSLYLSAFCIPSLFNVWYKFGQNDLMSYGNFARENKLNLAAYSINERYSLQYYYSGDVIYLKSPKEGESIYVKNTNIGHSIGNNVLVVEHNRLKDLKQYVHFVVLKHGVRYDLVYDPKYLDLSKIK